MAKKPKSIDEIMQIFPDDHPNYDQIISILTSIKMGAKWTDDIFVNKFIGVPNTIKIIGSKNSLSWLPRNIQVDIGKVSKIKGVVLQPSASGRKAVYARLDGHEDLPIIDIYAIKCQCGNEFLGREPEHQLHCDLCKIKSDIKPTNQHKQALKEQIEIMIRILNKRNLKQGAKIKVEQRLKYLLLDRGLTPEEIDEEFEKFGYPRGYTTPL